MSKLKNAFHKTKNIYICFYPLLNKNRYFVSVLCWELDWLAMNAMFNQGF